MALLFMDGFDHYDGSNSNLALGQYLSVAGAQLSSTQVRTGSRSVSGVSAELIFGFPALQAEVGFGFGYFFVSAPSVSHRLCGLSNSSGVFGTTANLYFYHLPSGAIEVRRSSSGGTVLHTTAPSVLSSGTWQHIEIRASASNSAGEIEIRVNEVIVANVSGLDTVHTGTEHFASVLLDIDQFTSVNPRYIDDFFVWNTSGTINNDFIGDRRVLTLLPNANQATQDMTVTGAANAYTALRSADGDTSYLTASDSVPVTSEFGFENAGDNVGAISAVQVVTLARKTEAGAATMQVSMISGSDVDTGDVHSIADSYSYYEDVFETNPATGAPWNASTISSASFRLRRLS
jgi:hypothetical protein